MLPAWVLPAWVLPAWVLPAWVLPAWAPPAEVLLAWRLVGRLFQLGWLSAAWFASCAPSRARGAARGAQDRPRPRAQLRARSVRQRRGVAACRARGRPPPRH
eukprot:scaffold114639_cov60-Phaeocystis_antarctica.AAC.2